MTSPFSASVPNTHLVMHGSSSVPQEWLAAMLAAKKAARGIVKLRFEAFGCTGHAARIKPVPLEAMVPRYH